MLQKLNYRDLRALYVFVEVVDCQGVSAAQGRLDMAQSSISLHLKHLEDQFGFVLCQRGRGGFLLTEEGKIIYEACKELSVSLDHFYQTVSKIQKSKKILSGDLKIALVDELPYNLKKQISATIQLLYNKYPMINLEINILSPHEIETQILNNRLDIGFGYFSTEYKEILYNKVANEVQNIYCGLDHPLMDRENENLDLLIKQVAWVRRGYNVGDDIVPVQPLNLTATAKQMETTLLFIMAGTHVGYLPMDYATPYVKDGVLFPIFPDLSYTVPHYFVTKNPNSPLIKAFSEVFKQFISS